MIEYAHLVNWLFFALASLVGGGVLKSLHELVRDVGELNVKIAAILEKSVQHERRLEEHANRIQYLERQ